MPGSADRLKVVTPSVGGTVGGGCGRRRALFEVVAEDPALAATSAGLSGRLGDHRRAARRSRPVWRLLRGLRDRARRLAAAGAVAQYRQLGRGRRTGGCGRHRLPARGVGSVHLAGRQQALIVWPMLALLLFALVPGLRRYWRIAEPEPLPMAWSWGLSICLSLL